MPLDSAADRDRRERYRRFYQEEGVYVPLFAQPWYMDAVCGEQSWSAWMCEHDGAVFAAMPYYLDESNGLRRITKAPLAQINGIVFCYPANQKPVKRQEFEERVVNEAVDYLATLGLDVYEQQYHYTFTNWLPFFWRGYTAITRYTYLIEDTSDMEAVTAAYSAKLRSIIRKGWRLVHVRDMTGAEEVYECNRQVFAKQGLPAPFSFELFSRLYEAASARECCRALCAEDDEGNVHSFCYVVWDDRSMYLLMGGSIPAFSSSDSYSYLIHHCIGLASSMGLKFDFEGSVIKGITKAIRNFGGVAKPYFRIRMVYNADVVRKEAEEYIERTQGGR